MAEGVGFVREFTIFKGIFAKFPNNSRQFIYHSEKFFTIFTDTFTDSLEGVDVSPLPPHSIYSADFDFDFVLFVRVGFGFAGGI